MASFTINTHHAYLNNDIVIKTEDPLAELNQCVLNPAYGFVVNVIDIL